MALIERFVTHTPEGKHVLAAEKKRVARAWAVRDAPLRDGGLGRHGLLSEAEKDALREKVLMDAFGE